MTYEIILEACEPESLYEDARIGSGVITMSDLGSQPFRSSGCHDFAFHCDDHDALLAFVMEYWGNSGDTEWERELLDRITAVSAAAGEERKILTAVEEAWYEVTKGELQLAEYDGETRTDLDRFVLGMYAQAEEYIRNSAMSQTDSRTNEDIHGDVDEMREIPYRIARALALLWWGA